MIILFDICKIFCRLFELLEKNGIGQNFLKIKKQSFHKADGHILWQDLLLVSKYLSLWF